MVPDPPQAARSTPDERAAEPVVRAKVRIRFRKDGDLRLVSHRDLMKCFERMCRRAGLPVAATQGFNPRPRMVFPLSLALGVVGCQEVVELELDGRHAPEAIHAALARQAPPGLTILSVRPIDRKASGQPRRVCYRVPLPTGTAAGLPQQIESLLAASEYWVERTRPRARRLDLRPYLRALCLLDASGEKVPGTLSQLPDGFSPESLEIDLWVTPGGMARPEEVLEALGLRGLLDAGVVLERALLELHDETPLAGSGPPTEARRERTPACGDAGPRPEANDAPRPTPLLPGPLTFDT